MVDKDSGTNAQMAQEGIKHIENAILELLFRNPQGLTNAQIAKNQHVSLNTIKWHLQNIYSKFDVKNRTSLSLVIYQLKIDLKMQIVKFNRNM